MSTVERLRALEEKVQLLVKSMPERTVSFEEFFKAQYELLEKMGWPGGKNQEGAHKQLTAAMVEIVEALSETNWKVWKPNYLQPLSEEQRSKLKTELTDIMQFVINTAIYMDFTAQDLSDGLRAKLKINHERTNNGETTRS